MSYLFSRFPRLLRTWKTAIFFLSLLVLVILLAPMPWMKTSEDLTTNTAVADGSSKSNALQQDEAEIQRISREKEAGPELDEIDPISSALTLVRIGSSDGLIRGVIAYENPEIPLIEFQLSANQFGAELEIASNSASIVLEDGWTAIPDTIAGKSVEVVKLFPPLKYRFIFRNKEAPIVAANVIFLVGDRVVWDGITNEMGLVEPSSLPPGGVHILLQTGDLWVSWRAPNGYGPIKGDIVLDAPNLLSKKKIIFSDNATGLPIADVSLRWASVSNVGGFSGIDGLLNIPARSEGVDVLEAIAPGYQPRVVSLSEESSPILMERLGNFMVRVKTISGEDVVGAKCIVIQSPHSIAPIASLGSMQAYVTDENGICRLQAPLGEEFGVFAFHQEHGTGIFSYAEGTFTDKVFAVQLSRSPLKVGFGDWLPPLGGVQVKTISGDAAIWSVENDGTLVFPDADLIDSIDFEGKGAPAGLRRAPKFATIKSLFDGGWDSGLEGYILLDQTPTLDVPGRTLDQNDQPKPWALFELEPFRSNQFRLNLERYPGLQGYEPTMLDGWMLERNKAKLLGSSDGSGRFLLTGVPVGEYLVNYIDPSSGRFVTPIGMTGFQPLIMLPVSGDLIIPFPNQDFMEVSVVDSETGNIISNPALEIAYDGFGKNSRVIRLKFFGESIRTWFFWNRGAEARLCATGYEPRILEIGATGTRKFARTIELDPVPPMTLDFGAVRSPQASYDVVFFRPPGLDGAVLESTKVNLSDEGTAQIAAPFPGCIVSIKESKYDEESNFGIVRTTFTPGAVFRVNE